MRRGPDRRQCRPVDDLFGLELEDLAQQRARGAGDGRQGRAQIMGNGTEQRVSQAFLFRFQQRPLRLLGEKGAFDRHGGLVRKGLQIVELFRVKGVRDADSAKALRNVRSTTTTSRRRM